VRHSDDPSGGRRLTAAQLAEARRRELALKSVLALAFNDLATANAIQKNYPAALGFYQQAEHWDSGLSGLEKNLGLCAFRSKDYAEAARALAAAQRQGDDSSAVRGMLGLSWFATDKFADAVRTFEPLGPAGMTDSETGYAWAASLAHTGDMKRATEVLAAYESQPRAPETLLLVGQLWTEIGDYARAVATLERALDSEATLPRAHFYEGLAYIRWEHWPDAAKEFEAELNAVPDEPDALYHLGFVDQQQSRIDEALALYLKVIAANPDYVNAQYEAGKILMDRGDFANAAVHLQAAASLSPDKDYIHYQLQAAYRKLGRDADADRELEIYKGAQSPGERVGMPSSGRHTRKGFHRLVQSIVKVSAAGCRYVLRAERCRADGRSSDAAPPAGGRQDDEVQRTPYSAAGRHHCFNANHLHARVRSLEEIHHGIDERRSDSDRL
jgi:tetratricopeptide (TPR) repeat protein